MKILPFYPLCTLSVHSRTWNINSQRHTADRSDNSTSTQDFLIQWGCSILSACLSLISFLPVWDGRISCFTDFLNGQFNVTQSTAGSWLLRYTKRKKWCFVWRCLKLLGRIDLSSRVIMELQQVLQRRCDWIYVLTLLRSTVWHRQRRGSDWAVCYCKLAGSHCGWLFLFCLRSFSQRNCHTSHPLIKLSLLTRNRLQIAQLIYSTAAFIDSLLFFNGLTMKTVNRVTHREIQVRISSLSYCTLLYLFLGCLQIDFGSEQEWILMSSK